MGYALWLDGELAYAEGAHEYRGWGSAVVGIKTQFRLKDFRRHRGKRPRNGQEFAGLFPSLEEVNAFLKEKNRQHQRPSRSVRMLLAVGDVQAGSDLFGKYAEESAEPGKRGPKSKGSRDR